MDPFPPSPPSEDSSLDDGNIHSDGQLYDHCIILRDFPTAERSEHQAFVENPDFGSTTSFHYHPPACVCPPCLGWHSITNLQPSFPIPFLSPAHETTPLGPAPLGERVTAVHQLFVASRSPLDNMGSLAGLMSGTGVPLVDPHSFYQPRPLGLLLGRSTTSTLSGHDVQGIGVVSTVIPEHTDYNSTYCSVVELDVEDITQPGAVLRESPSYPILIKEQKLSDTIPIPQRTYSNSYGTRRGNYNPAEQSTVEFWNGDRRGVLITDMLKPKDERPKLRNGEAYAFANPKACASLRIGWIGLSDWSEQFGTTTDPRAQPCRPITIQEAGYRVCNKLMRFFEQANDRTIKPLKHAEMEKSDVDRWKIGPRHIRPQNVLLVSLRPYRNWGSSGNLCVDTPPVLQTPSYLPFTFKHPSPWAVLADWVLSREIDVGPQI